MTKIYKFMNWRLWILGINLLFILVTAIFPYIHDGVLKWNILVYLDLAGEMNLAVWWSGSLLLLCGVVAYQNSNWDIGSRSAWIIIALLFSFFSLDEIGSIHERVGNLPVGLLAYVIIALLSGSGLMIAILILWKNKRDKHGLILLFAGVALLASAAPNEYLEHHLNWPNYLVGPRIAFEEGLEITGAFISLISIARYQIANKLLDPSTEINPGHERLSKTSKILLAGFLLHIGTAWITVHYIEIGFRGNPAIWYYTGVFLFLAFSCLLQSGRAKHFEHFVYLFISCYFLVLSASSMYFIFQKPSSRLDELGLIGNQNVILVFQLVLIFFLYKLLVPNLPRVTFIRFFAVAVALGLSWFLDDQFVIYLASGFFAFMIAILFLSNENGFASQKTPFTQGFNNPYHRSKRTIKRRI